MYQQHKAPFGEWEQLVIQDQQTGTGFSLVPEMGACLLSLQFQNHQVLDGFETGADLKKGDWAKSAFLFPFPNRLKDGLYQHHSKVYQFPITDVQGNNAIHGLGQQKAFDIQQLSLNRDSASVTCLYKDEGLDPAYPFPFEILVEFSINNQNEFEVLFSVTNKATHAIPFGLGWHPYFRLDDNLSQCSMQLPECSLIEVDERMIPTGVKTNYLDFSHKRKIEQVQLDTCFELKNKNDRASILFENDQTQLEYWQEASIWPFFQIFTPPNRRSLAIEPMSCNIDAFNNEDGLIQLASDQQYGGRFGVKYTSKK